MDRHLFRGKRVENDVWIIGYLFIRHSGTHEISWFNKDCQSEWTDIVKSETIGQCTGIKDLNGNGKLIFEGDILLVFYHTGETEKFTVVWDEELCGFRVVDKYGKKWTLSQTKCQIIGNIHDKEGE